MNDYLVQGKLRFAVGLALFTGAAIITWATVRGLIWLIGLLMLLGLAGCQHTPVSDGGATARYMLDVADQIGRMNRPAYPPIRILPSRPSFQCQTNQWGMYCQ